jgi:hypothetical protein
MNEKTTKKKEPRTRFQFTHGSCSKYTCDVHDFRRQRAELAA